LRRRGRRFLRRFVVAGGQVYGVLHSVRGRLRSAGKE
jgi:hypothetical protein